MAEKTPNATRENFSSYQLKIPSRVLSKIPNVCFLKCAKVGSENLFILCVFKLIKFIFSNDGKNFSHVDNALEKSLIAM
jgi:hypothetical protein